MDEIYSAVSQFLARPGLQLPRDFDELVILLYQSFLQDTNPAPFPHFSPFLPFPHCYPHFPPHASFFHFPPARASTTVPAGWVQIVPDLGAEEQPGISVCIGQQESVQEASSEMERHVKVESAIEDEFGGRLRRGDDTDMAHTQQL